MKKKWKKFLNRIREFDFQKFLSGLRDKIVANKKGIFVAIAAVAIIFFVSFLIEYFGFGRHLNIYRFRFISAVLFLIVFFFVFRRKIGERPEVAFLAIALICGTLLIISESKEFVSWDEGIHYKRVERLAANVVPGMYFRPNFVRYSLSIDEQAKIDKKVDSEYKKPKTKNSTDGFSYKGMAYIPSVIGLAVGNLLRLPFHIIFNLGRWFNLLAYAVVIFFAIRKLKSGKMIMSVIALFPTAIFLASNYTYDSWVTAFTMLGLAYLFSELQQPEKKISISHITIMVGAFVIGIGPKAIYFPLMFLLFLIGRSKFESEKEFHKFLWVSVFSISFVAGSFVLPFFISGEGSGGARGKFDVDTSRQIQFILAQPFEYAKILVNFLKDYVNPLNASGFTNFFAYLGMTKGFYVVLALISIVTLADKNRYDKQTSNWKIKMSVISVYFVTAALISSALYLSFTEVGKNTIDGVQPRYLIPLVFPLLFVLGYCFNIKDKLNKNIFNLIIFCIMAIIILNGIWELIIVKYY
ncbi:MAG: DUF2142 domain-containing protein [Candidatus Moraniibacteriota bacterium]